MTNEPNEPTEIQTDSNTDVDADEAGGGGLSSHQATVLLRLIKVAYPHPNFPDAPYERTAKEVQEADADGVLPDGLDALDQEAGGDFCGLSDEDATAAITKIASSPFFLLVHSTTVVKLYDDHEVWELLGYEGSSFEKGGYVDRGFDDLDWLPDPRITELDEPRVELVDGGQS